MVSRSVPIDLKLHFISEIHTASTGDHVMCLPSIRVCDPLRHAAWCRSGVRLAQAEALMQNIEAFLRERFGDRYSSVPVVLAGDLNNVPGVDVYR